jgi:hypothetical protein
MATEPENMTGYSPAILMAGFNKYGLPGAVIGSQFLIIAAMLYFVLTTFQANIKAMTEMTVAVNSLKEAMKECK